MMIGNRVVCGVVLVVACYGTYRFCRHQTGGFTVAQVTNTCCKTELDDSKPPAGVLDILGQTFAYLGKGKQCFVFASADGQTVLKLFNDHYQTRLFWLSLFPFFSDKRGYNQKKLASTFASYQIANEQLKEQTGLVYLHANESTHFKQRLTLIDKLGIAHSIDLNKTGFLLQKRAQLVYPALRGFLEKGRKEEAKEAIAGLLQLIKSRCKKGIADNDALIRTNFGVIGTTSIQIDVGPFSKNSLNADPAVYAGEIVKITAHLREWLAKSYPELVPFLDEQLAIVLSSSP